MAMDIPVESMPGFFVLETLSQFPDAWNQADDWTGVTSTAERKKRQNRINQRAYRRRKATLQGQAIFPSSRSSRLSAPLDVTAPDTGNENDGAALAIVPPSGISRVLAQNPEETMSEGGPLLLSCLHKRTKAWNLIRQAYEDYRLGAARLTNLQIVIRLNVLNALSRNALAMGFPPEGLCRDEFISPYCQHGPVDIIRGHSPSTPVPHNLRATVVQQHIPHHPWIDLFPFPRFRDNMLHAIAVGALEEDELCLDMMDVDIPEHVISGKPSFLVWGESWDDRGWEASVPFLLKWGWLLRGCPEIIESTNRWRQQRGEKKLVFSTLW